MHSRFVANQLRPLFSVAAYALLQTLESRASRCGLGAEQIWTMRARLLKIAVWVERVGAAHRAAPAQAFPWRTAWRDLAQVLTAT